MSLSIGVTVYPEDAGDAQSLVIHADKALYDAKRAGKNVWRLYESRAA